MELEIVKAEEGLCNGQVLYHSHINKPAAEVAEKTRDIKDREELRVQRRKQQVCDLHFHFYACKIVPDNCAAVALEHKWLTDWLSKRESFCSEHKLVLSLHSS